MKRNFLLLLLAFVTVACTDTLEEGKKEVGDPNISVLPEVGKPDEIDTDIFSLLNLDYPGLEKVKAHYEAGEYAYAAHFLLEYYRSRTEVYNSNPDLVNPNLTDAEKRIADQALEHRYYVKYGGVESTDETTGVETYWSFLDSDGNIDWSFLPAGVDYKSEFSYQKNRLQWMIPQAKAYRATGNEEYLKNWIETWWSWLAAYPCPEGKTSSMEWTGLQLSSRISVQTDILWYYIHSENFTPALLTQFLKALSNHMECLRNNWYKTDTSNIRLSQDRAYTIAAIMYPEFRNSGIWLNEGAASISTQLDTQFLEDGVHNEFDISYHFGETGLAAFTELYAVALANDKLSLFPSDYTAKLYKATQFMKDVIYPNYSVDNFNDTRSARVSRSVLLRNFRTYSSMFPEDQELMWVANQGAVGTAPSYRSKAYPAGGYYMLRTGWDAKDMMLIHKSNANVKGNWHCQPDNGHFSLYRNGRRFLPDAGVYTYDDEATRKVYASTYMHNTITKNKENITVMNGRMLKMESQQNAELIVTENPGYADLTHRRAIFLVENKFFVVVDEAYGSASDVTVNLNFKLCADTSKDGLGREVCVIDENGAHTVFNDDNNMIFKSFSETSEGYAFSQGTCYYSDEIDTNVQRKFYQLDVTKKADLASRFITVILPYGKPETFAENAIEAQFTDNAASPAGTFRQSGASVKVTVNGVVYNLSYTL